MIPLLLLATLLICLLEGVPLIKKRLWRELGAVGFLMGSAIGLGFAKALGILTPITWLQRLLGPIGEMIFK